MAGKKYYAVKKGLVPGIYLSWEECEKNVKGFPGASFRGFATEEEAQAFLAPPACADDEDPGGERTAAYVDGSYMPPTGEYSYGVVLFHQGQELHFSEKFTDPEGAAMRNVAGEIEGARKAMEYCLREGVKSLDLYYDYEGIEKWCTGEWRATKRKTLEYQSFYEEKVRGFLDVHFHKVEAHTGVKYNELADSLAKQAFEEEA